MTVYKIWYVYKIILDTRFSGVVSVALTDTHDVTLDWFKVSSLPKMLGCSQQNLAYYMVLDNDWVDRRCLREAEQSWTLVSLCTISILIYILLEKKV